eukprot:580674-Rhodomonas_salina.1
MPKLSWLLHSPVLLWINDEMNKPHIMAEGWNESGGSTGEMFLQWLKVNFHDTHNANWNPLHHSGALFKATKEDPVVVLLDGHWLH